MIFCPQCQTYSFNYTGFLDREICAECAAKSKREEMRRMTCRICKTPITHWLDVFWIAPDRKLMGAVCEFEYVCKGCWIWAGRFLQTLP